MTIYALNDSGAIAQWSGKVFQIDEYRDITSASAQFANNSEFIAAMASGDAIIAKSDDGLNDITDLAIATNYLRGLPETDDLGRPIYSRPSVKLMLSRLSAANDTSTGIADAVLKIPGTVGDAEGRTISGGSAWFKNQAAGDYVVAEVRDDDNLLGYGAGTVLDSFHDLGTATGNAGWYFFGSEPMNLRPVVSDDPTDLPSGMYLHVIGHKAIIATVDDIYVNIHWGKKIR